MLKTGNTGVFGHNNFFSDAPVGLVNIAAFAQVLPTLGLPTAQVAYPLA
jgi:hypothetical protein